MNLTRDELWMSIEGSDVGEPAEGMFPSKMSLAMSYVPYQRFEHLYDEDKALERGTLFACLDLPFHGRKERG